MAALRAACYAADGRALIELLRTRDAEPVVQQCGDALTAAVTRDVPTAVETAARCLAALRARNGEGDEALADQLTLRSVAPPLPCARCPLTWRNSPACRRAIRPGAVAGST